LAKLFRKADLRIRANKKNLAYFYYLLIQSLLKEDLIPEYNEIALNEFIKNTYEVFDKQPQKDMIIDAYKKMKIDIRRLITHNILDDNDSG
jgi:hypothetical protein